MRVAIGCVVVVVAACSSKPSPSPASRPVAEVPMTATRDIGEIARRLRALFADRDLSPRIDETADRFTAAHDMSEREIAGGAYVIDRRPNHPPHVITSEVAGPRGFKVEVSLMPMLPQIVTQYMAPPSPRGGILQQFANDAPDGEKLSTTLWFTPDAMESSGPYLVVELETGRDMPADFADAVLDRIAPVTAAP